MNGEIADIPRAKVYGGEQIETSVEVEDENRFEPSKYSVPNISFMKMTIPSRLTNPKILRRSPRCGQSGWYAS